MDSKQYHKEYYLRNREKRIQQSRTWYANNKKQKAATSKKWEEENRENRRVYLKAWHIKNRQRRLVASEQWRKNHKEHIVEYHKQRGKKIREIVLKHYGGNPPCCACCGEKEVAFLAIDHINGGGSKHRKEIGGITALWAYRNNFPPVLQILCHNCNMAKHQQGICPHKYGEQPKDTTASK